MTSLGRKKTESNCLANFPRTISQTSYLFRQSRHKWKIRDKTRGIVHNCSDLTCTKKYALTEGPQWGRGGGEIMWATRSAPPPPPVIFCLLRAWIQKKLSSSLSRQSSETKPRTKLVLVSREPLLYLEFNKPNKQNVSEINLFKKFNFFLCQNSC